jgi:Flp pilus assembly protein TadD
MNDITQGTNKRLAAGMLWALALSSGCATSNQSAVAQSMGKTMLVHAMQQRSWDAAFALARDLHLEDPDDPDVLARRGVIYRVQGLYEEAETDLKAAIELDGDLAYAHAALGVLYDSKRRFEEAEACHRRAAQLRPTDPKMLNNLAFSLALHGKLKEAIPTFRKALSLDPTDSRIRNNLGFAYGRQGDLARAARQFELAGGPAEAKNNLGLVYEQRGDVHAAQRMYEAALQLDPDLREAKGNHDSVAGSAAAPASKAAAAPSR